MTDSPQNLSLHVLSPFQGNQFLILRRQKGWNQYQHLIAHLLEDLRMILSKRVLIIIVNALIGYQAGKYLLLPSCEKIIPFRTPRRKLFFIAILRNFLKLNMNQGQKSSSKNKSTPKYPSRQEVIYQTWLRNFSSNLGDVKFIESNPKNQSNILYLKGVDDNAYPPQRKSFQLLHYMYKKLLQKYDFFLRIVRGLALFAKFLALNLIPDKMTTATSILKT